MSENLSTAVSRRDVLKTAGVVGAGIMAFPYVMRGQASGDNSLIRVGLVGCGGRGSGAADQTLSVPDSNVKLVAIADAFASKVESASKNLKAKHGDKVDLPPERCFSGLDAYTKVFEHCDLVILATPPGFRPMQFEAAVKAGKHIFMEKPVCVDAAGARRVLEAAKEADSKGLKIVVGLQRHYEEAYRETYKRVKDGMIGDIIQANVYWNGAGIWWRKREEGMTDFMAQVHNWYHFNYLSGDHICEQHVHNIDVANWFLGETPVSAFGVGGRHFRNTDQPSEIFDHFAVNLIYPSGASVASQCRQYPGQGRVSEDFRGTKGMCEKGKITDYKGNVIWKFEGKSANPYQVEHNELHDFIRKNISHNDAYYGATSTFTAVLARNSVYMGKELKWDASLKLNDSQMPASLEPDAQPPVKANADGTYTLPNPRDYKLAGS
ncbi:MAG: Gfo/Idh/MocA family oxidoreductase [Verrucomicrobiota bacterium]